MMLFVKTTLHLTRLKMNSFVDTVMLILFLLFMVFIFGGYHKTKSAEREAQREREEEKADKKTKE